MYIGCARNLQEVDSALTLATLTFRSQETPPDKSVDIKRLLVSPYGTLSKRNVVVLINSTGEVCGACFLVDRDFYRGAGKLKGTFLSSICIAESSRGKGLSKLLMNGAIAECEHRGTAFAILIARRAADYFYNKFSFWGLSQYSNINVKLINASVSVRTCSFSPAIEADLAEVSSLYESTYSCLYGACARSFEYWKHVLWKIENQKHNFVVCKTQGRVSGYAIFSGSDIYELASTDNVSCFELLHNIGRSYSLKDITINCSREHPIVRELHGLDFSLTQRQCNYGGHMVRIINDGILLEYIKEEIKGEVFHLDVGNYAEMHAGALIELRKGNINITLSTSPFGYENTCFLMGVEYLSATPSGRSIYKPRSFNVPLADQV